VGAPGVFRFHLVALPSSWVVAGIRTAVVGAAVDSAAASVVAGLVASVVAADSVAAEEDRVGKRDFHISSNTMMARSRMSLDDFVAQLKSVHGSQLRTIVLYGSAATNEHIEGLSDLNLLVLVDTLSMDTLRALGQSVRAWNEAGNPPPLTLTVDEWTRSADIFPMEYSDILERHRVLHGTAPFADMIVDRADLRLQLEREAMGKLLRLRQGVMAAADDAEKQRDLMRASFSTLLVLFRAAERLAGRVPPRERLALVREVASRGEFEAAPFERVESLVKGGALSDTDTRAVLAAYVRSMEMFVVHLDGFNPPGVRGGTLST